MTDPRVFVNVTTKLFNALLTFLKNPSGKSWAYLKGSSVPPPSKWYDYAFMAERKQIGICCFRVDKFRDKCCSHALISLASSITIFHSERSRVALRVSDMIDEAEHSQQENWMEFRERILETFQYLSQI